MSSCSELAAAAGEALAGSASQASRWLLLEVRGSWGRDAVADSGLPDLARQRLEAWAAEPGTRVLLLRRPERRSGPLALFLARSDAGGGELRRLQLERLDDLAAAELEGGDPHGPLWLVCAHGRRDPCCARLGRPLLDALAGLVPAGSLWQSSHQGGHRFAANVLVLPYGIQLGRVGPADAAAVVGRVEAGEIPVDHYRGRTFQPPEVQAAEAHLRRTLDAPGIDAIRLVEGRGDELVFETPAGRRSVRVAALPGPSRPESCGAEPAASTRFAVA